MQQRANHSPLHRSSWRHQVFTALVLTLVWLLLADGDPASLLVGLPSIAAATWCVSRFSRRSHWRWSVTGLIRLTGYFAEQTLLGAWDIASRSCGPRVRVTPGFIDYSRPFPRRAARTLFISCVNLLPGTLAVSARGDELRVHVVDLEIDHQAELDRLGQLVDQLWINSHPEAIP